MSDLTAFSLPDLSEWNGLPATLSFSDIERVFIVPPGDWHASGHLGEDSREYVWLSASAPTFPDSIRVWFSGDKVVLMDTEVLGDAGILEALVGKLGDPAAKLDSYFASAPMPRSEWVYPERGLTLFVEPETHALLRLAVYPATTLEEYRKDFRPLYRPAFK